MTRCLDRRERWRCLQTYANTETMTLWAGADYRETDEAGASGLLSWTHSCTGPFQGPGRNPNNSLKCSEILQLICERKLIEVFPDLTAILKVYVTFPTTSCAAERNFSNLWIIIKNKFRSIMLEGRLNYFCILPIENVTSKSLSYEKAIKKYAAKKCWGIKCWKWCVRHFLINILCYFSWFCDVCGVSFFKLVIYCDFFSHCA
jgi:hypothetical protein